MQSQTEQLTHSLHAEMHPEFFKGISQMIIELMICLPDFHQSLDNELLEYIYNNVSKRRCDLKNHSHLSKHKIDAFLKSKRGGEQETKTNTGQLFLTFLDRLGNACEKYPDKTIPISGEKHFVTFRSLFDQCGLGSAGYAPKAARESLINAGCIELAPNNRIKFITKIANPMNSKTDTIRQISNTIFRYISTQFQNMEASEKGSQLLMERAMSSKTIPEFAHEECFDELRAHFQPPHKAGKPILEKYENDNYKPTHIVGYQFFCFKTKL